MCTNTTDLMDREHIKKMSPQAKSDLNADPISGEPGAHPVATGLGVITGATAGTYMGMAAGPVGSLVGATIGAVLGGLAGHSVAEAKYPVEEDAYWRETYSTRPYYQAMYDYDRDYRQAYMLGYEARTQSPPDEPFDLHESTLKTKWTSIKAESRLSWEDAKQAIYDGWERAKH